MGRTVSFRVINNRVQFKCSACGAKRSYPIRANLRRKNMRCHKCGAITQCLLNRRIINRELQSGKATLITSEGKEIEVNIHDISTGGGIGVDLPVSAMRSGVVRVGQNVRFRCMWNSRLLGSGMFKVVNSNGQRVGVKKIVMGR